MKTIICQCKNCGGSFTARVADRKRGWAKCCGKSCAAILKLKQGKSRRWQWKQSTQQLNDDLIS